MGVAMGLLRFRVCEAGIIYAPNCDTRDLTHD
jgi:hypothetical protein